MAVDADVVRLRRGDLNALSELITRYQNRLYRYLLRIARSALPIEADKRAPAAQRLLHLDLWIDEIADVADYDPVRLDAGIFQQIELFAAVSEAAEADSPEGD